MTEHKCQQAEDGYEKPEEHVPGISPILDMIRKVLPGKDIHIVKVEPKQQ